MGGVEVGFGDKISGVAPRVVVVVVEWRGKGRLRGGFDIRREITRRWGVMNDWTFAGR